MTYETYFENLVEKIYSRYPRHKNNKKAKRLSKGFLLKSFGNLDYSKSNGVKAVENIEDLANIANN
jgi:hypothetical protein